MRRLALAAACVLALAPRARAAAASNGAATLRRALSSRSAALGGAFSGVAGGLDSLGVNPAGTASLDRPQLLTTVTSGVADDTFGFFGYGHPFKYGVAAAGFSYYDAGTIGVVTPSGPGATVNAQRDYVGTGGWAMGLGGGLSAGAVAKVYQFSLADVRADGFAADAGARWATPVRGLSVGAAAQNLGPGVKFEAQSDPLPLTLRGGAAWSVDWGAADQNLTYYSALHALLTVEGIKVRDEGAVAASGAEFALDFGGDTSVSLRAAYVFGGNSDGVSFGVGVREGRFTGDYALVTKRDLGNVQNISLGVRF
ncbi:MAG: PorV/PorQ family protein [Elusimicrobia bacterium]|nr:PorV/PorQ family protein [Elusimicrobiota bacterium]